VSTGSVCLSLQEDQWLSDDHFPGCDFSILSTTVRIAVSRGLLKDGWFGKRKRVTESRADEPGAFAEKRRNLT
jgi:hypothetical protein